MTAPRPAIPPPRILLHLPDRRRRLVDPEDLYYLEEDGDDTLVRLRGARPLRDVRRLGEILEKLEPLGFVRVHRNHAINPRHVRELRPARKGDGWELRHQREDRGAGPDPQRQRDHRDPGDTRSPTQLAE